MIGWIAVASAATWIVGRDGPTVQATVDQAAVGDVVVVPAGDWPGPVVLNRAVRLTSVDGGRIVSSGEGHTVVVASPGVFLDGLRVHGSGGDLRGPDSCVFMSPSATGSLLLRGELTGCLFGVWIHQTRLAGVVDSSIEGWPSPRPTERGNGIQLFDADRLDIRGNRIRGARDGIYVSATENSAIVDNDVSEQRYGIHYMYSYDNTLSGNLAHHNSGGIALMASYRLDVGANDTQDNRKQGLLLRDLRYSDIHDNVSAGNAEGLFLYFSIDNDIHGNVSRNNEVGARIWGGTERNRVWGNSFVGNGQTLFYTGTADQTWGTEEHGGNYWSDHVAWDQDRDGFADRPYRADPTVARLLHRWPSSVLLLNSPALELVRAAQQKLPVLRIPTVIDPRPLAVAPFESP